MSVQSNHEIGPSCGGVTFADGVPLLKAARKVRFNAAGQISYVDAYGYTSPTLDVVAGEAWVGENIIQINFVGYSGTVTGAY